jgi:hypothetical protein
MTKTNNEEASQNNHVPHDGILTMREGYVVA